MTGGAQGQSKPKGWLGKAVLAIYAVIAIASLFVIANAFREQGIDGVIAAITRIAPGTLALAVSLVVANYALFVAIEAFAHKDAHVRLDPGRLVFSAFTANAIAIGLGAGALSGTAVRARLFQRWGFTAGQAAITAGSVLLISLSGGAVVAAAGLIVDPQHIAAGVGAPEAVIRVVGLAILAALAVGLVVAGKDARVLKLFGHDLHVPHAGGVGARLSVAALDWVVGAAILYVLLPPETRGGFFAFVTVFAAAHFVAMATGAPAGLGVFDAIILHVAPGGTPQGDLLAALLVYRAITFLAPLALALTFLAVFEARSGRPQPRP
jgi:phosphatidylglycerol lysyltransferase